VTPVLLLLVFSPSVLAAQARNDCRLVAQVIRTGYPAPHSEWAREYITRCGAAGGRALADRLSASRRSTDAVLLDQLTKPAARFVDGSLFETAAAIALDETASTEARVFAFRVLVHAREPGRRLTYGNLTGAPGATLGCFGVRPGFHFTADHGAPLPPNPEERIRSVSQVVYSAPTSSSDVRRAARCAQAHAERVLRRAL
jgi:hypothetical protein